MKIYKQISKSMYGMYLFWKKKMGYVLYFKNISASHIVLQRGINCLNRENDNRGFRENMDFDLQNMGQSHSFDENLKWFITIILPQMILHKTIMKGGFWTNVFMFDFLAKMLNWEIGEIGLIYKFSGKPTRRTFSKCQARCICFKLNYFIKNALLLFL